MGGEEATNVREIEEDDDEEEEAGEEIESAPPLIVGQEREFKAHAPPSFPYKKKLLKRGSGWDCPDRNDEVTIHYVGTLLDGSRFESTRERDVPVTLKLGRGEVVSGLDDGLMTMKKGECALFTFPPQLAYGAAGRDGVPPDSAVQFEVELVSWITVVDVSKDGGIVKKILVKGEGVERPGDLDEVLVKYRVALDDGTLVARSPEEGIEFYVRDGHLCQALPKAILTMRKGEKAKLIVQPQYAFGPGGADGTDRVAPVPPNSTLDIELELVLYKPVLDVSGDGKVLKKILREGEGTVVADEGASVSIIYTAKLQNGTLFEKKGFDGELPLQFITDEEQVIAGLDRAAVTMKKGERAMLTIGPDYGFGSIEVKRDLASIPSSSTLVYDVEMLDFIKEKSPWEMNNQEKIEAAERKKQEGNLLFKSGKYRRAGKKYDKAVDYVGEEFSFVDDEKRLVKGLWVSCWLNGAACSLKLDDFQVAINLCSKVLDFEFENVKALYRRAQAYMQIGDLVSAEWDVKKALEVDPQNRELKSLQKTLRQLQAESNRRDAKLYSKMFAPRAELPPTNKKLKTEKAEDEERDSKDTDTKMDEVIESSAPADAGICY